MTDKTKFWESVGQGIGIFLILAGMGTCMILANSKIFPCVQSSETRVGVSK